MKLPLRVLPLSAQTRPGQARLLLAQPPRLSLYEICCMHVLSHLLTKSSPMHAGEPVTQPTLLARQLAPIQEAIRPRPRSTSSISASQDLARATMYQSRRNSFEIAPLLPRSGEDALKPPALEPERGSASGGGGGLLSSWQLLVGLCALSVVICYADRSNISTAILPMAASFGWDKVSRVAHRARLIPPLISNLHTKHFTTPLLVHEV